MRRYRIPTVVAAVLLGAGGTIAYVVLCSGVRVVLRNTGQERMQDVTIRVTGRTYFIGDLTPGSSRIQKVSPTTESHVEVDFTDEKGNRVHLDVGCLFEPGYWGKLDIEIRDGKVVAVKDEISNTIY